MSLTKINKIGERHYHVFSVKGERIEVDCTREDLDAVNSNKLIPTLEGGEWFCSGTTNVYDTVSGRMEEDTFSSESEIQVTFSKGKYGFFEMGTLADDGVALKQNPKTYCVNCVLPVVSADVVLEN